MARLLDNNTYANDDARVEAGAREAVLRCRAGEFSRYHAPDRARQTLPRREVVHLRDVVRLREALGRAV